MNDYVLVAFILYLVAMLAIGVWFFIKGLKKKNTTEKDYFLGGRQMSGLVAAFSAGASDMSAWVLMGLPTSICLYGLGQVWISIGLFIGTVCAWLFIAPKLRRFAIKADDSITIPQFLSNRFKSKNPLLQVSCAVIFVIAYCVYTASSLSACGELFNTVLGIDGTVAMIIAAVVILLYTLLGGFNAVCWTDLIQGLIMLGALMIVPIVCVFFLKFNGPVASVTTPENYYNLLSSGSFNWASIASILSGLGWGLGYFGMPHILIRYMSIKSEKEMKKSQIIGIAWIFIILTMATVVGLVGHEYLGSSVDPNKNLVFVDMVKKIFGYGAVALIGGIMLSAIVAAAMSTADSQLLASSSSFASDIYKTTIRKNASEKEMQWVSRGTVMAVIIVAFFIAINPNSGGIMGLVESAWGIFGAAFGPVIIFSLYWKRFNYVGAVSGILSGFAVSVFWMLAFNSGADSLIYNTGLYELVPGFIVGTIVAVVVTLLTKAPSQEVVELYESVGNIVEQE